MTYVHIRKLVFVYVHIRTVRFTDVLDVNDFTTWTPDTWALLDWDTIAFPIDPAINVASVRYYVAVVMILWYQADLRGDIVSSVLLYCAYWHAFDSALNYIYSGWPCMACS